MRWTSGGIPTDRFLRETAHALRADLPMLRDHGVVLALETHFEFTTFEILRVFEMCGIQPGDALGICLDTMNLLTMLEDPAAAVRRVAPWIVTTHIKDGGLLLGESGLMAFPAEIGKGVVDIPAILAVLAGLDREVTLSIEDHGGDFVLPLFDPEFRKEFPDLSVGELSDLLRLVRRTQVLAEREGLAPLDRSRWPQQCQARVRRDIAALKAFAGGRS
jgi:sugar phosphate isomerase/epimerase